MLMGKNGRGLILTLAILAGMMLPIIVSSQITPAPAPIGGDRRSVEVEVLVYNCTPIGSNTTVTLELPSNVTKGSSKVIVSIMATDGGVTEAKLVCTLSKARKGDMTLMRIEETGKTVKTTITPTTTTIQAKVTKTITTTTSRGETSGATVKERIAGQATETSEAPQETTHSIVEETGKKGVEVDRLALTLLGGLLSTLTAYIIWRILVA